MEIKSKTIDGKVMITERISPHKIRIGDTLKALVVEKSWGIIRPNGNGEIIAIHPTYIEKFRSEYGVNPVILEFGATYFPNGMKHFDATSVLEKEIERVKIQDYKG